MRASIPKIAECYPFLIHCSGTLGGNRNIGNTSKNIKYDNIMKNRVIYHNEGKRVTI